MKTYILKSVLPGWHFDPATFGQLKVLGFFGTDISRPLTKGVCSGIIGRLFSRVSLIIALLFCFTVASSIGLAAAEQEHAVNIKESAHGGVKLTATVPQVSSADEPIPFSITIKNESSAIVKYDDLIFFPKCKVSVADQQGRPQRFTAIGEKKLLGEGSLRLLFITLAPSQSKTYKCDLRKCFDLTTGHFEITLALPIRNPQPVTVTVEKLRFEILN